MIQLFRFFMHLSATMPAILAPFDVLTQAFDVDTNSSQTTPTDSAPFQGRILLCNNTVVYVCTDGTVQDFRLCVLIDLYTNRKDEALFP